MCVISCLQGIILQFCSEHYQVNLPFFTVTIGYFLMVCMLVLPDSRKRKLTGKMILKIQMCGIFDMIGNVLSTFAHNYTSAASVALLTSLDSIFSYLLSLLILKAKKTLIEFLSVLFIVLMSVTYVLIDNDT